MYNVKESKGRADNPGPFLNVSCLYVGSTPPLAHDDVADAQYQLIDCPLSPLGSGYRSAQPSDNCVHVHSGPVAEIAKENIRNIWGFCHFILDFTR